MTTKDKFKNLMAEWKTLEGEAEKKAFLQRVKSEIDAQGKEGLLEGMQALSTMAKELHDEVVGAPATTADKIVVSPTTDEETALLRSLLTKMNIPFKEVRVA